MAIDFFVVIVRLFEKNNVFFYSTIKAFRNIKNALRFCGNDTN